MFSSKANHSVFGYQSKFYKLWRCVCTNKEGASESKVEEILVGGKKRLLVKRDELYSLTPGITHSYCCGNKSRKLYSVSKLLQTQHNIKVLKSYGGNQSNSMLAIASLAKLYGIKFEYFSMQIPQWQKDSPSGNLQHALSLGMMIHEIPKINFQTVVQQERSKTKSNPQELWIERGGFMPEAEEGLQKLALEVNQYVTSHQLNNVGVIIPSGTGTSAYYLKKHINHNTKVITVPCVGDADYLNSEFNELREQDGSYVDTTNTVTRDIVIIDSFQRDSTKKFIFGKPYIEFLNTYRLFKECNFEVDLLYATKTLYTVLEHWHQLSHQFEHLMYIHTGGLTGNSSQLERYNREGLTRL